MRHVQLTLIITTYPTPGSYPRKGKADSASTSHDEEEVVVKLSECLHANTEIRSIHEAHEEALTRESKSLTQLERCVGKMAENKQHER